MPEDIIVDGLDFDFWNFFGGLITGVVGGGFITLKWTKSQKAEGRGNVVDQSGSKAKGDIVGRDKRR